MLKHCFHFLYISACKVNEDVFIYLSASTPPMFIVDWGQITQAIVISCITGTIPLIARIIYRKLFPNHNKNDE